MTVEYGNEAQIEQFKGAENILFSADITNEEAMFLQSLKENQNKKLVSPEAKAYQEFLKAYSSVSGYHLFKGDIAALSESDTVISFGVWFENESDTSTRSIRKMIEEKSPQFVYMHPIEDASLESTVTQFIKYEVGSEEGVAALLVYTLLEAKELPEEVEAFLDDLDIGYLSAESNVGEEELESMYELLDETKGVSLVLGSDLYSHPKADQIAKLLGLVEKYTGVQVVCLPPAQNALGVALLCQFDDAFEGKSARYQSSHEGTYVDVNRCLYIPDEVELSNKGRQRILDSSKQFPNAQGFRSLQEGDLTHGCIYKIEPQKRETAYELDEVDDLPVYDGALVYSYQVQKRKQEKDQKSEVLTGSKQFAMATKLQDGDQISYEVEGVKFMRVFKIDTHMKGVIALNPVCDINLSADLISSYRFSRLAFEKINQNIGNNDE